MKEFLNKNNTIAIVGASTNPQKYGYRIFRHLLEEGYNVFPINPKRPIIEGIQACATLSECPQRPDVVIIVIPPDKQQKVIEEILSLGINKVWFQPGSENKQHIDYLKNNNVRVLYGICYVKDGLKQSLKQFVF